MASAVPSTSMSAGGAVGSGSVVDFTTAKKNVSCMIIPSAALAEGIVTVEASMDSTNWVVQRTIDVTGRENFAAHFTGVAFRYWRATVVRTVSGGTVRVIFMEAD